MRLYLTPSQEEKQITRKTSGIQKIKNGMPIKNKVENALQKELQKKPKRFKGFTKVYVPAGEEVGSRLMLL